MTLTLGRWAVPPLRFLHWTESLIGLVSSRTVFAENAIGAAFTLKSADCRAIDLISNKEMCDLKRDCSGLKWNCFDLKLKRSGFKWQRSGFKQEIFDLNLKWFRLRGDRSPSEQNSWGSEHNRSTSNLGT
jgi:hypothetical protein